MFRFILVCGLRDLEDTEPDEADSEKENEGCSEIRAAIIDADVLMEFDTAAPILSAGNLSDEHCRDSLPEVPDILHS